MDLFSPWHTEPKLRSAGPAQHTIYYICHFIQVTEHDRMLNAFVQYTCLETSAHLEEYKPFYKGVSKMKSHLVSSQGEVVSSSLCKSKRSPLEGALTQPPKPTCRKLIREKELQQFCDWTF